MKKTSSFPFVLIVFLSAFILFMHFSPARADQEDAASEELMQDQLGDQLSGTEKVYTHDGKDYFIRPQIYESDSEYTLLDENEKREMSFGSPSLGKLYVTGEIYDTTAFHGQAALDVDPGTISIGYNYSGELLEGTDDAWHLVSDNSFTVDGIDLEHPIENGCMIVQVSYDAENYDTIYYITNLLADFPDGAPDLYVPDYYDVWEGTFYRILIVYQTEKLVDGHNDRRCHMEKYEFYIGYDDPFVSIHSMVCEETRIQLTATSFESSHNYLFEGIQPSRRMALRAKPIGSLGLWGQFTSSDTAQSIPSVTVADQTTLIVTYNLTDVIAQSDCSWELVADSTNKVSDIDLGTQMGLGAIIYQTSFDGLEWQTDLIVTDAFKDDHNYICFSAAYRTQILKN